MMGRSHAFLGVFLAATEEEALFFESVSPPQPVLADTTLLAFAFDLEDEVPSLAAATLSLVIAGN